MSVDRKKMLEDALDTLMEMESIKNFDFELWKARYLKWLQSKKMRITDFFRRQDKDGDGFLSRDEFVNGMLQQGGARFVTIHLILSQTSPGFYMSAVEVL